MNPKNKKTNIKLVSIILIISILLQLLMPILMPLKSFATETEDPYVLKTKISTIKISSPVHEIKAGETVPIQIEITGTNIVSLMFTMHYDENIFVTPKKSNVICKEDMDEAIKPTVDREYADLSWRVADSNFSTVGQAYLFLTEADQVGTNITNDTFVVATINLVVKDTVTDPVDISKLQFTNVFPTDVLNGTDEISPGVGYEKEISIPVPLDTIDIEYNSNATEAPEVTNMPSTGKKNKGEAYTIAQAPTRDGYRFMGWNTSADGNGGTYKPGSIYTVDAPLTLYAQWKQIKIKYEPNAGADTPTNMPPETNKTEDNYTIPSETPQRTGYNFASWNTKEDGSGITYKPGSIYTEDKDLTLYAQWEEKASLTIKYEKNTEEAVTDLPEEAVKELGKDYIISTTIPKRTGYNFVSWNVSADGSQATYKPGNTYKTDEALTLYAQWEKLLTITYEANGTDVTGVPAIGTKEEKTPYEISGEVPTRTGYEFKGWNTVADGTGTAYQPNTLYKVDEDLILYAQWEKIELAKITYKPNGTEVAGETDVTGMPEDGTKTKGEDYTITSTKPVRAGYEFIGWNTVSDGTGITYQAGNKYKVDEDLILYAQWEKIIEINIDIIYNANGTDVDPASMPANATKEKGKDYTIGKAPTREGYRFTGWNTAQLGTGGNYLPGSTYSIDASLTLYAQWEKEYTLTINPDGGEYTGDTQIKGIQDEKVQIATPTVAESQKGHTITLNMNDGTGATETIIQTKSFDKWQLETEKGNLNESIFTFADGDATIKAIYKLNEVPLTTPTRARYTFKGWYTKANITEGREIDIPYIPEADETLYAQWEENSATTVEITYDANVETADMGTIQNMPTNATINKGDTYTIGAEPTRNGYIFKGWNIKANGTELMYQPGNTYKAYENLKLYAIWEEITSTDVTITYDANVPDAEINTVNNLPQQGTKAEGATYEIAAAPTREGYRFIEWNMSKDRDEAVYKPGDKYKTHANLTLYAIWEKEYTLTVNSDGGTYEGDTQIKGIQNDIKQIATPTSAPEGYTVTLNMNDGTANPEETEKKQTKTFEKWELTGKGNISGTTYTFADGDGQIKAIYKLNEVELPIPTREGYSFKGWYTTADPTSGEKVEMPYTPEENVKLYASWQENDAEEFTLTIKANGGKYVGETERKGVANSIIQIGQPSEAPKGHKIVINPNNGTGTPTEIQQTQSFDKWEKTSGEGTISGTVFTFGETAAEVTAKYKLDKVNLGNHEKPGCEIEGWYTTTNPTLDPETDTKIEDPENYIPTRDETIYPNWIEKEYKIIYKNTKDSDNSQNPVKYTISSGTLEFKNLADQEKYTFKGWYLTEDGTGDKITSINVATLSKFEDIQLYAQWEKKPEAKIEITYNANVTQQEIDTVQNLPQTATVNNGEAYTIAAAPTRTGYIFKGWNIQPDGTQLMYQPGNTYKAYEDIQLYAIWEKESSKEVEIIYNAGVEEAEKDTVKNMPEKGIKAEGATYEIAAGPTRTGYVFTGWNTSKNGDEAEYQPGSKYKTDANLTLFAQWEKETGAEFTLTIKANGGTYVGDTEIKGVKNAIKQIGLPAEAPKGNIVVVDLNNGTGIQTEVQQTQSFDKWEKTSGEGTVNGTAFIFGEGNAEVTAKYKLDKVELVTPERVGYELEGWYISPNLTANPNPETDTKIEDPENYIPTRNEKVYANWKEKEYKITYNNTKDSDNSKNPIKYTIKDEKLQLEDLPDQEKYTFKGWYLTEEGTGEKITSIDITKLEKMEDIQLYAKWEEKEPQSKVLFLESEKYKVGEKNIDKWEEGDVYLDKIEPDTTVAKLKENCDYYETLKVITLDEEGKEKELKDDEFVGTGMTIRVEAEGNDKKIELKAVVMDDLDGDGHVTPTDLSTIKHVLQEEVKLEGAFFLAADLDDSKEITPTDLSTINQVILEVIKLTYTKNAN